VGADRQQVGSEPVEADREVTGEGTGVDVDGDAVAVARLHHLGHGLDGAHLVVGRLAVDEGGRRPGGRAPPEGVVDLAGIETTGAVDAEKDHGGVALRGVADRRMLHAGEENRLSGVGPGHAPGGGVGRFGAAGREHDLAGPGADESGHAVPGVLDDGPDDAALGMDATGIGHAAG
jgi:hypothetical protein